MKQSLAFATILVLLAFTAAIGQGNHSKTDAPDLKITKLSWRGGLLVTSFKLGGAFSVEVKNTGAKRIVAVNWQYILVDTVRQGVFDVLNFRTDDKPVEPGKSKKFTKRIEYPIVPNYIEAVARIMKVEYADGTYWERPTQEPE